IASDGQDGYDDLIEQLNWLDEDERMKNIVEYLILNLNETGYLMLTNKEILDFFNIDDSTLERAIEVLQSLDPLGVGARDLAECLLIQARYLYPEEEDLHSVLTDHLEDLANRRWNEITKSL